MAAPATRAPSAPAPAAAARTAARTGRADLVWTGLVTALLAGFGALIVATAGVFLVRIGLSLPFMQDFLAAFPGEYHLPPAAEPGFPAWVQWQHFLTVFLMAMIIRSGLQVRTQKRPDSFWTPRWSTDGRGKMSLMLWFHLSVDLLWIVNGVIFIVLLFVTGHWMRIVPTSWEVFPNAVSAALQYASLDWPTHNGWVNYNSLQQLMYFLTIFVAAPLAVVTGARMSFLWPKGADRLNRWYPVEWARAVHFPVMLYFVGFIVVHVTLVFTTGALRNLNHIYGGVDTSTVTGLLLFAGSVVVVAAALLLARPALLAPVAGLLGRVSNR